MKKFKVAFLLPAYFGSNHSIFLGIGYLAAVLKNMGNEAIVLDEDALCWIYSKVDKKNSLTLAESRVVEEIQRYSPDVLCISINTTNYRNALRMLKYVREKFPRIFMIVGGPHISTCYSTFQSWHKDLYDAAIIGEGEVALCSLIENLKQGQQHTPIQGVCYSAMPMAYTPSKMVNIKQLPFPDRSVFFEIYSPDEKALAKENYNRVFYANIPGFENHHHARVVASRGCYNSCTFCSPAVYWRNPENLKPCRRIRKASSIVAEVEQLLKTGVQAIFFDDPTFPIKSDMKFFSEFEQEVLNKGLDFHWGAPICSNEIDTNILDRLQKLGFSYTYFGLENYQSSALKNFSKNQDIHKCIELINECTVRNIHCDAAYQIGLPNESLDDIKRSINWIFSKKLEQNTFYSITAIWPETELAKQYNVTPDCYEPDYDKKTFEARSGLFFYEQGNDILEPFYSNCSGTYHFIPMDLAIQIKYYLFDNGLTNRFAKKRS